MLQCLPQDDADASTDTPSLAATVDAILAQREDLLDYAQTKLAIDRTIDPALDSHQIVGELDRLADHALHLAASARDPVVRLAGLRRLIYEAGSWNGWQPFAYDHSNLQGRNVRLKLLCHYLSTRRGDCVSMPLLFLILAEKLQLRMTIAAAPNHLFLRWHRPDGVVVNLEATSGAQPARDEWIRLNRPMSDRAIASGMYMRSLTRRETAATMATTLLQHLMDSRRFEEAVAVSEIILRHNPSDGLTLANQGNAVCGILRTEFLDRYRSAFLIPMALRPRYLRLLQRNRAAFAAARQLGWEHGG
ncbi:MAG TPA: transglutaminase family protein [Allosphingosinicella sp.]|jgi:regulator of sirC expression with transglutaminase-like and TPR domain